MNRGIYIPEKLWDFLMGYSAIDGYWFAERRPDRRGLWWWRTELDAAKAQRPTAAPAVFPFPDHRTMAQVWESEK